MPLRLLGTIGSSVQKVSTAFESIATATGTGSSGTITFSSIPSTYQHLHIRFMPTITTASQELHIRLNSDTGTNYTRHRLIGNGSTVVAGGNASTVSTEILGTSVGLGTTYPGCGLIDILDYASTTKNKTIKIFAGLDKNGSGEVDLYSGVWQNTAAINTITIYINSGNFTTSSTFALYGIRGA